MEGAQSIVLCFGAFCTGCSYWLTVYVLITNWQSCPFVWSALFALVLAVLMPLLYVW